MNKSENHDINPLINRGGFIGKRRSGIVLKGAEI
jgi:hypothetical protein